MAPNSNDEKLVALDSSDHGPSGFKRRTREAERSSFLGHLNDSQKEKGLAVISGAGDFDEITGGKVVTPKNSEAEISHMAGIRNLQIKSLSETQVAEMDGVGATSIECGCCYWEYGVENMVQCPNGHRFCFKCITKRIDEIIYGGLKAHGSLSCMAIDFCDESIHLSEIRRAVSNDGIERYEYRQAQEAIVEAKIEGLVYCPFCNTPYEIDKCVQVLDCPNPKCLKASCIQCKKLSHLPLRCEEVENKSETVLRREVEERMTKAVIRECNICQAKLIKTYGCNRMTCVCGNTMCYICRRTLSYSDDDHFCGCLRYNDEPGKPCQICNRCSLIQNEIQDNEALAAREEALRELVYQKPELLHLEIGPPLERSRRQPPTPPLERSIRQPPTPPLERPRRQPPTEEHGHHVQHFPPHGTTPPPEFNELGDEFLRRGVQLAPEFNELGDEFLRRGVQLANMAVHPPLPPPELFGFGHQFANMDVPPPHLFGFDDRGQPANMAVQPQIPLTEFFRFGDQRANMDVPPQHLFRFDDGGRPANMAVQPQLPPSEFFRFGDQRENMDVPPPHFFDDGRNMTVQPPLPPSEFFRFGDQRANIDVPPPHFFRFDDGGQPANMDVPQPLPPPVNFIRFGDQLANMAVRPPHFFRFGNGDQRANMAVPPPLPLPHSFRFCNGDQLVNMVVPQLPPAHPFRFADGNQLPNMDLQAQQDYGRHLQARPPHFFRFGNGDQLANVAVRPPLHPPYSFRFGTGDHLVNMVVPPLPPAHLFRFADGNQLANMDLQAQQDYGRHLQR